MALHHAGPACGLRDGLELSRERTGGQGDGGVERRCVRVVGLPHTPRHSRPTSQAYAERRRFREQALDEAVVSTGAAPDDAPHHIRILRLEIATMKASMVSRG